MSCTHTGTTQNIARGGGIFAILVSPAEPKEKSAVVAKRTKVSELKADSHDLSFTLLSGNVACMSDHRELRREFRPRFVSMVLPSSEINLASTASNRSVEI